MEHHRGVGDIERLVGIGEGSPICDGELQPGDPAQARPDRARRLEHLRPAVRRRQRQRLAAPPRVGQQGQRNVGAAGSDVEDRADRFIAGKRSNGAK